MSTLKRQFKVVFVLLLTLMAVELINILSGRALHQFGIIPREWIGLRGIVLSPFIHGGIWHFSANILPLCIFVFLAMQYGMRCFIRASLTIMLLTGLLVWIFARDAVHIGASGMVYGYFGFLLLAGLISRRLLPMIMTLLVGATYGGLIFGVLPTQSFVSWESHMAGFLVGLLAAKWYVRRTS